MRYFLMCSRRFIAASAFLLNSRSGIFRSSIRGTLALSSSLHVIRMNEPYITPIMSIRNASFCSSLLSRVRMHCTFSIRLVRDDSAFSDRMVQTRELTSFSYDEPGSRFLPNRAPACRHSSTAICWLDSSARILDVCTWMRPRGYRTGTRNEFNRAAPRIHPFSRGTAYRNREREVRISASTR